jgi:small subunit ribosomal protein S17
MMGANAVTAHSYSEDAKEYASEISDIEAEYERNKARRQALVGVVISNKAAKSITVDVRRPKYVAKYEKTIYKKRMFMAHDEDERCKPGDVVRIVPCRPMSRRKRHTLIDVIKEGVNMQDLEDAAAAKEAAAKEAARDARDVAAGQQA